MIDNTGNVAGAIRWLSQSGKVNLWDWGEVIIVLLAATIIILNALRHRSSLSDAVIHTANNPSDSQASNTIIEPRKKWIVMGLAIAIGVILGVTVIASYAVAPHQQATGRHTNTLCQTIVDPACAIQNGVIFYKPNQPGNGDHFARRIGNRINFVVGDVEMFINIADVASRGRIGQKPSDIDFNSTQIRMNSGVRVELHGWTLEQIDKELKPEAP